MRRAITLIEIIVVIIILVILAALFLPTKRYIKGHCYIRENNNNLRRIIEAQIGYSSDWGTWAFPSGGRVPGSYDRSSDLEWIGRTFILLAQYNELSAKLFCDYPSPVKPSPDLPFMTLSYDQIVYGGPGGIDVLEARRWAYWYAYDWTAPQNSRTCRPIIGMRTPDYMGGKGVCVGYGDGHANFLQAVPSPDWGETAVPDETDLMHVSPVNWQVLSAEAGVFDDIYRFDSHLGEHSRYRIGRGSSTLAWLR